MGVRKDGWLDGDGDLFEDFLDDVVGGAFAEAGLGLKDNAVAEGEGGELLDFIGGNVFAAADDGEGLGAAVEAHGGAGAGAQLDLGMGAGGLGDTDDIVTEDGVDIDALGEGLEVEDIVAGGDGGEGGEGVGVFEAEEHVLLLGFVGVAEVKAEEETVELGRGEGEGALELDGVLGGDDEEGSGEGAGNVVYGELAFAHGLEEGGLGTGGSAVNFVGEEDVGEDGAGAELEGGGLLVKEVDAGDIGGHEVWGELDTVEGAVEGGGESAGESGLTDTGDVLDQDVAAAKNGCEGELDDMLVADEDEGDVVGDVGGGLGDLVDQVLGDDGSVHGRGPWRG